VVEPPVKAQGRRCPVCGRGILRPRLISEVYEYGDEGDSVLIRTEDVPIEDCYSCGKSFSGPKAARIRHEAIGRSFGLLPPQDIRAIRERLGRSPDAFARLIGVGADRLSQWEDGSLWQDRTADRLIRLLASRAENVEHLESLVNGHTGETEALGSQTPSASTKPVGDKVERTLRENRERAGVSAQMGRFGNVRPIRPLRVEEELSEALPQAQPTSSRSVAPESRSIEPQAADAPNSSPPPAQETPPN
jgi:HTH-type transcriptional regulator/antitoxin MqsA